MNQLICGELSLNDQKSCNNCIRYFSDGCDHVVLKVEASEDVQVINLEQIFLDAKKESLKIGGLCDWLMYSDTKIALAELTCCLPQYLENCTVNGEEIDGKRAKAYSQLSSSIEKLPTLYQFKGKLDSYNSKVVLFAYRVKKTAFLNDKATRAMDAFRKMSPRVATDMDNGFLFVPLPYPEVYKW